MCRFEVGEEVYYSAVGYYGARCTCRQFAVWGRLCVHVLAALILWEVVSLMETGRDVDILRIMWLGRYLEEEEE